MSVKCFFFVLCLIRKWQENPLVAVTSVQLWRTESCFASEYCHSGYLSRFTFEVHTFINKKKRWAYRPLLIWTSSFKGQALSICSLCHVYHFIPTSKTWTECCFDSCIDVYTNETCGAALLVRSTAYLYKDPPCSSVWSWAPPSPPQNIVWKCAVVGVSVMVVDS